LKINYDVTIDETKTAFMAFWRKYQLKRTVLFSIVFAIGITLSVNLILNNAGIIGWVLLGLAAGLLANLWLKPRRSCKKLTQVLELMDEEKYSATFNANEIEIETLIKKTQPLDNEIADENTESPKNTESPENTENPENAENPENTENTKNIDEADEIRQNSVYSLATEELYSKEIRNLFLLYVNRSLIYVFPKRCLSEQQIEGVRNYFAEKNI